MKAQEPAGLLDNLTDAIQLMQEASKRAPEVALYRRNLGELFRRAGQFENAIAAHTIATTIEPHSAENHFLLGLAYNDHRQFELAIQQYHTALSYNQHYGAAWNNLGASLESLGDKHTAKIAYTTAIALNSKHAEAHNNLGVIYSEEGRLNEAETHFRAAIAAQPDFIDAHYNWSLIKTYTAADPHFALLESISKKIHHYPIPMRIRYYFALGKALDDTQQYTRAFEAYAEGNRLHYLHQPCNNTKLDELIEHLPKVFTPSFLKKPQPTQETRCPIFIVGMPRSGTTLIEQILSSHNSIYGAGELPFLDDIIQEACQKSHQPFHIWAAQVSDQELVTLGETYMDRVWQLAPDKKMIIDKMPANCFYMGMIYRLLPTAKIIHAIRDPMDSCFSCFTHLFKSGMSFTYDLTTLGHYYTLYAKAMQHWYSVLPKTAVFNVPYEEMITNHEKLSKQLIDYLGLAWDPNCLKFYNNNRRVKTASLTQVRKPIYTTSVQRWRHFSNELEPLLKIVAPMRNIKGISS